MSTRGTMTSEALRPCPLSTLPINTRSCGVIGVPSSVAAVAPRASIVSRWPRGRRSSRNSMRKRDSDPGCSGGSDWPSLADGSVSLIKQGSGFPCSHNTAIGIWYPQPGQYLYFASFHRRGLRRVFVVKAEQVEHAMHDEMAQMIRDRLVLFGSLAAHRFKGKYDIAEQHRLVRSRRRERALREGQDVGRRVLAAIGAIEMPLLGIVGEHNVDNELPGAAVAERRLRCTHGDRGRMRAVIEPGIAGNRHLDRGFGGQLVHVGSSPPRAARSRAS